MLPCNSHDFDGSLHQITKTVQANDPWKMKQKEFRKMIENWWRLMRKSDEAFWRIWEVLGEILLQTLVNVIVVNILLQLWLNTPL